jgi:4-cresol dehydrogenase (hydroxylating)
MSEREAGPSAAPRDDAAMRIGEAVASWRQRLGPEAVLTGDACLPYTRCTMARPRRIPAVLKPRSEADLVEVVRIAARQRVPLYPISTGRNWGYGSANPVLDDNVVVDLSGMAAILAIDAALGTVRLQPGVTQGQLADHLEREGLPFMVPVTGAGPGCSIVGNALERGYGITPHSDHFAAVLGLRAVLADGSIYESPLSEALGAAPGRLHKWGVGPYLDGLFGQGAFGIVTEMSIALARRPERTGLVLFEIADQAALGRVVEAVRALLQTLPGHIGGINLLNRLRVLSMIDRYPADAARPGATLPGEVVEALASRRRLPAWLGLGALYAPRGLWRGIRREVRRALAPHCRRVDFFTGERIALLQRAAAWLPGASGELLRSRLVALAGAHDLVAGRPRETALGLAYWRSGRRPETGPLDPARDGCGLAWYSPVVPLSAAAARSYVEMVETICPRYGIEPLITLTTLSERCFDSTVPLLFDAERDRERARACYAALLDAGRQRGFLPYRLNIDAGALFFGDRESVFWPLVARLKAAADPLGIIAPGRYAPMEARFNHCE